MKVRISHILFAMALVVVALYLGLYIYSIFIPTLSEHHTLFLIAVFLVFISTSFTYKILEGYRRSSLIEVAIGFLLIMNGVVIIFPELMLSEGLVFDIVLHMIITPFLVLHVLSIYQMIQRRKIAKQINRATFENNDVVFIDYNYKKRIVHIELSSSFANHYQASQTHYKIDLFSFKTNYLHPEDYDIVTNINKNTIQEGQIDYQHKFRLRLPGMDIYSQLTISRAYILGDHLVFVGFDLGLIEGIREKLTKKERELLYQAIETRTIIEGTKELVGKIDLNGNVVFATQKFSDIYIPQGGQLIGQNIFELNAKYGQHDTSWFTETIKHRSTRGQSHLIVGQKHYWIAWDNEALVNDKDEVESIITIGHDVTELIELNNQLKYQSTHSHLTGLLNQVGLHQALNEQKDIMLAVCFFLHLSDITAVTNYYGMHISNELIKTIGQQLTKYQDNKHLVSHYTNEQFVVILINPTENEIIHVQNDMKKRLLRIYPLENTSVQAKIDIGYALYPQHTNELNNIISLSSLAMKESSFSEHNLVVTYEPFMTQEINENIKLAVNLQRAIEKDEMTIVFQHIVDTRDQSISYVEALARWQSQTLGIVRPDVIFKTAKRANMVDLLDEYLVEKSCRQYAKLIQTDNYRHTLLTLNIATASFMKTDFVHYLLKVVKKLGLHPSSIAIEVSENTFVHNIDAVKTMIKHYRQRGFLIAIDDFGREYSSLAILENIDYDIIKIDGAFVNNIASKKNQIIIDMITKIATLSEKIVIAESVETQFESEKLIKLNCFYHQGYYFHRPEKLID